MSEVKWIKITTDMFDNRKIKQLEAMPDGDSLVVIWMKILCLAANVNDGGFVYFTKDLPYTETMLSTEFNKPVNLVNLALKTFEHFRMIEIVDNVIKVSNWAKYQNIEGLEKLNKRKEGDRERKRRQREREKEQKLLEEEKDKMSRDSHVTGCDISRDPSYSYSISNSNSSFSFLDDLQEGDSNSTTHESVKLSRSVEQETYSQDSLNLKEDRKPKKRAKKEPVRKEVYFPLDDKLNQTFKDYVEMREKMGAKKAFQSVKAIDAAIDDLMEMANGDNDTAIKIIRKSLINSWQGLFPLKDEPKSKPQQKTNYTGSIFENA